MILSRAAFALLFLLLNLPCEGISQFRYNKLRSSSLSGPNFLNTVNATGTFKIIAVMVEFQPDTNRFTSGDGTFNPDYLDREGILIDPLPHDRNYFLNHLQFVQHYFSQASRSQIDFDMLLLPGIITMDQEMAAYAPTGPDNSELFKLEQMVEETWQKVGEQALLTDADLIPGRTAFIIFHAGAGRDIELLGTTLDKTPQDIPSLSLDLESLARIREESGFAGYQIPGLSQPVTNTLVLPETESRIGQNVDESTFVLQLSINGLLCASVGSFLGLPDLFNTETGESGIGQFGLMDGAAIFAYNGLFPPLPSAWERIYLGWETPDIINTLDQQLTLDAVSNGGSILRVDLNESEYYLLEYRHRVAQSAGITLSIAVGDGSTQDVSFGNQDENFIFFNPDSLEGIYPAGVLVGTNNYDWALPGGLDPGEDNETGTEDDRELNGGLLIWHIDEAVIQSEMANNAVNANPERRGIDLEEADGAQDIGRSSLATEGTTLLTGSPFDFWWSGNNYRVIFQGGREIQLYQNRFSDDTSPNTRSNTGSFSGLEFNDLSGLGSQFILNLQRIVSENPESVLDLQLPLNVGTDLQTRHGLKAFAVGADTFICSASGAGLFVVNASREIIHTLSNDASTFPVFLPPNILISSHPNRQEVASYEYDGNSWVPQWATNINTEADLYLQSTDGQSISIVGTGLLVNPLNGDLSSSENLFAYEFPGNRSISVIDNSSFQVSGNARRTLDLPLTSPISIAAVEHDGTGFLSIASSSGLQLLSLDDEVTVFSDFSREIAASPALVNSDNDQYVDLAYAGSQGFVFKETNSSTKPGSFADPEKGWTWLGAPLVFELESGTHYALLQQDSISYRLVISNDDFDYASRLKLSMGSRNSVLQRPAVPVVFGNRLFTLGSSGRLQSWDLGAVGNISWAGFFNNEAGNFATASALEEEVITQHLLIRNETYNWPNPARESTYLRFATARPSDIDINIYSMSGTPVKRIQSRTTNAQPVEVLLDTSMLGSGVYFARVKASSSGDSDLKIVKIAVVR